MKNIIKTVNLNNLKHNIKWIKENCKNICAVVKANAYGHRIENIVPHIKDEVSFFAVNTIKEAKRVRHLSQKPILVLCGFCRKDLAFIAKNNVHLAIFCKKQLHTLINYARKHNENISIHLKLNTGMNRLGFSCLQDIKEIKTLLESEKRIKLCGIFTHFGGGNILRDEKQTKVFEELSSLFPKEILRHSKSSSYMNLAKENEMVRAGLFLYGYGNKNLKPVLEIKARIIFVGVAKKDEFFGYGINFTIKENTNYAVISIGYADGLPRNYSKSGYVLIHGKKAKICGNICMNMTIVNIDGINAKIDDYATILSEDLNANIIAKKCKTICYEILTNFGTKN